ncbi:MAG: hypothetical protein F6J95_014525 [Leptolyngbya sp. SIO1E4]|nr:hypothetical protein [Leptolyngbya sp. SIO1E4]
MSTPRLVVALLVICGLVTIALQNTSPSLALVFLGFRSITLPLGVWLSGAIALGALTTLALTEFIPFSATAPKRPPRRRWQVRPDAPSDRSGAAGARPSPRTPPREAPKKTPRDRRRPEPTSSFTGQNTAKTAPRDAAAAEDWQTWGQRTPASQWEDWSQAGTADPADQRFSKRQRKDREKAENAINDISDGWAGSAQETVYVASGGSAVEDALDEISEGWDDWESEAAAPSETAYSYRYRGAEASPRVDAVYGPPDDVGENYPDLGSAAADDSDEDWGLESDEAAAGKSWQESPPSNDLDANNESEASDGVYDADYRVIIPPHRPLEEDENDRDRTS